MKRETREIKDAHYSPEIIRKYENPEYRKAAEEYERQAISKRAQRKRRERIEDVGRDFAMKGNNSPRSHRRARRRRRGGVRRFGRIIRNILILLLILAVGIVAYLMYILGNLDSVDTKGKNFAISQKVDDELGNYRNIAILGSDARKGEGYDGSRTDAIIILSINKSTEDTKTISVMRDSYIKIRNSNGELTLDKITHANAFGGGVNTISSLNRNLDLNIKEFMIFNWKAVADTVDSLGGVEVNVKSNEIWDLNHWGPETGRNVGRPYKKITKTGVQTLDGTQATTYCRIRKNSGGDNGRAGRYSKVMRAVLKKAVVSPTKINTLSKNVLPQIRTNMTRGQIASLMLKSPFMDMKGGISWPKDYYGGLINGVWYAVPRTLDSNVKRLHRQAFGQMDYTLSPKASQISDEIINTTGIR